MSVLFATITDSKISLCADKQATNLRNGKIVSTKIRKIMKWSEFISVGFCGNNLLSEIILETIHSFITEEGIDNYSIEEIAELVPDAYFAARDYYKNMPKEVSAKIVIAGKLSTGKLAILVVYVGDDKTDTDKIEGTPIPKTIILEPSDVTSEECNRLYKKAFTNLTNSYKDKLKLIEAAHRKAVEFVSKQSKYVSKESDYILMSL